MTITPNTPITLQQFAGIQNGQGAFKTYSDILAEQWVNMNIHPEIMGAIVYLKKVVEVTGDNIPLKAIVIPGIQYLDITNPMTAKPQMDRLFFHLGTDYESSLVFDYRDKRSAIDWSNLLQQWIAGIYARKSDNDNLVITQTLVDTCLATGNYIIIKPLASENYGKEVYYDCARLVAEKCDQIVSLRTNYHLGSPAEKVKIITSYTAARNLVVGQNYMSASNLSLEKFNSGEVGKLFGYENNKSIYFGKAVEGLKDNVRKYPKTYDFSKYCGLIYQLDSLIIYGHTFDIHETPINRWQYSQDFGWRVDGCIAPTKEPLNVLICSEAPTLAEINAARLRLRTEQPGIYNSNYLPLPDMTQEQVDAWNLEKDVYGSRVVVENYDDETLVASTPLLENSSSALTLDLLTASNVRNIAIKSPKIDGMSFDMNSIKLYGIDAAKIKVEPAELNKIKITAVDALTSGSYFTISLMRNDKKYGTLFVKVGTEA